jgi:hypothetical protein
LIFEGRGEVLGTTRKRSQWMLRPRRVSVDWWLGRIIHRMTRDTTRGEISEDLRVVRKAERGVVGFRARRWIVQSGILTTMALVIAHEIFRCLEKFRDIRICMIMYTCSILRLGRMT